MTKTDQLNIGAYLIKQAYANYQTMGDQPTYQPDDGYGMQAKILRGLSKARDNTSAAIGSAFKAPPPGYAYGQGPATASAQYLASQPKAPAPAAAPAAPAAQQDLTAQFKKFHGTAYDPNSSRDKKLYAQMQQLQSAGTPLTAKSVYGQQYGKQANVFTDAMKYALKTVTGGKGVMGAGRNLVEGAKGVGEGVLDIGSKILSSGLSSRGQGGLRWTPKTLKKRDYAREFGRSMGRPAAAGVALGAPAGLLMNELGFGSIDNKSRQEGQQEAAKKFMEMLNQSKQRKIDSGYFNRLLDAVTNKGY
jgi:hypothetical protein